MELVFYIAGAVAVISTALMLTRLNVVHSLLYLIVSFLGIAVVFFVLGAPFVAALEIIVYAGAIMVLFVFVIMLLNAGAETVTFQVSRFVKYLGAILLAGFLALIAYIIQAALPKGEGVVFGAFQGGTALDIGRKLFTSYLLPVEVTSVLILIALVGAIVLARKVV